MRIDQIFADARTAGAQPVSFEMFPPKGELTLERAREVAAQFATDGPDFISVTYSAGGSGNSDATARIASMISTEFGIPSVAHLTCISLTHDTLAEKISEFRAAGVENVLALRGDLPAGMSEAEAGDIAFPYAKDLIPALVNAGFCVGGAAYPEGHLTCDDLPTSVKHLKQKQDAGAGFFVTQLFFDNDYFYRFLELADAAGITVPITAGIMPFMSKQQITRMVFTCAASLPSPVIKILARYEDDPESLRQAGIEYACRQLEDLKAHGAEGLHVYTMNRPDVARACMSALRI
ncbi:methylenetetrahydrofolate reductase [NAD(P)H] [Collinsella sp. An271]|uniref:methylenetetrahydrofolate reductase n=1 Tax=Collinsella sp. An271 TaxID=1965616 RepID=UPI000B39E662|nr:methylenetetrahydrofolate reductase [Collinsella sp. An271]OUO60010.1 methylenetetrahydrofolate reductase [NAD(P)H] [Collinsella sp. An271]